VRATCDRLRVPTPPGFDQGSLDDALDLLLVAHIEPTLGKNRPLFLYDYPASQAALAKVYEAKDGRHLAQRFELYMDGIELANGYHELGDAAEQRRRFEQANRDRIASSRPALPIDEPLIQALDSGFPPCAGVALGFDRLLMIATGARSIGEVRITE
jgi:lysyl-tRNA synthetase class 2